MKKRACLIVFLATGLVGCPGPDPADGSCPDGRVCFRDAGPDAAVSGDAGDAEPPGACTSPPTTGRIGGSCRGGTECATGLTCAGEISLAPMTTSPLTLAFFEIPSGTEDPANPGEYIAGAPSDIPLYFATDDGVCTQACDPTVADDGCGMCASCSTTAGGAPALGQLVRARTFTAMLTSDARPGICRGNCNPTAARPCQAGATCDWVENLCIEGCQTDSQCNLVFGTSESDGFVAAQATGTPFTCNTTNGQCEWTAPATASIGSACDSNADCPAPNGVCLVGGRCSIRGCNLAMDDGMTPIYPCVTDQVCLSFSGGDPPPSLCISTCETQVDCFPGQSCRGDVLMGGQQVCWFNCLSDAQCHDTHACEFGLFADPTIGRCRPRCDPTGTPTLCDTDEICTPVMGETYGFCDPLNQLCPSDLACDPSQACQVTADNVFGRCVDGCIDSTMCDTGAGEECVFGSTCDAECGTTCMNPGDCGTGGDCQGGICVAGSGPEEDDCGVDAAETPITCTYAVGGAGSCAGGVDEACADRDGTAGVCGVDGICDNLRRGVCRAPGGACAPSALIGMAMSIQQPLRGDNQCISTQICGDGTAMPDELTTCQDPAMADGGTTDAGLDAGLDAGFDAGFDAGP